MGPDGKRGAGRSGLVVAVGAALSLLAGPTVGDSAAAGSDSAAGGRVFAASTDHNAELLKTVPIGRREGQSKRVAVSLGPGRLPELSGGDKLTVSAEVQLSVTCVGEADHRCIGRPYRFSPRIAAWIALAGSRQEATGTKTKPVSGVDRMQCSQRRPNRNHHCVLVISTETKKIGPRSRLPCKPDRCHLNLVVSASHPAAEHGNVVTVGADRPDGTVRQGQARLSAALMRGSVPAPKAVRSDRIVHRGIPIAPEGKAGRRTVYSLKLPPLEPGDVVLASARQLSVISHLPYNVFIGSRMLLSTTPGARRSDRVARKIGAPLGEVTEGNGFNCTHGPSAYRNPCVTRKTGIFEVRRHPVHNGRPVPVYLNLVVGTLAKLHVPHPSDEVRAVAGGGIQASVYSASG
jgi:hypothetical protein